MKHLGNSWNVLEIVLNAHVERTSLEVCDDTIRSEMKRDKNLTQKKPYTYSYFIELVASDCNSDFVDTLVKQFTL